MPGYKAKRVFACIEKKEGVQRYVMVAGFKVKMRSIRTACAASQPNNSACFNPFIGVGKDFGKMSIKGLHSVGMSYNNKVSISISVVGSKSHLAFVIRSDRIACFQIDVNARMAGSKNAENFTNHRANAFDVKGIQVICDGGISFVFFVYVRKNMQSVPVFPVNKRLW